MSKTYTIKPLKWNRKKGTYVNKYVAVVSIYWLCIRDRRKYGKGWRVEAFPDWEVEAERNFRTLKEAKTTANRMHANRLLRELKEATT